MPPNKSIVILMADDDADDRLDTLIDVEDIVASRGGGVIDLTASARDWQIRFSHDFDAGDGDFDPVRRVAGDSGVVSLGIAARAETPDGVEEVSTPSDEENKHFTHCATGVKVSDIEYRDCSAYVGNNPVLKGVGGTDFVDYSGAWNETSGRPARYIRLLTENDTYMSLNMAALFDSCTLRFARAGSTGTSGNGCIRISKFGSGFKVNPLFLRTSITSNLDKSPSGSGVLINAATYDSTDGCSFVDTSWIDTGTTANDTYLFNFNGRTCTVNASRSIFGYSAKPASQSYLCGGDNSLAASYHTFWGSAYVGLRSTWFGWSSNRALHASSEWLSAVDTTGQAMTAANAWFANLPNDATVTPGSTLWGNRGYGIGFRRPQLLRQRRGR